MNRSKQEKHHTLEELKQEYQYKMDVIEEIKREKELREQQLKMKAEKVYKKRAEESRHVANIYKGEKENERRTKKQQEEEQARQLRDE